MRTVKVLTVKQPWAFLLIAGIKDVENRNWPINYRGELFIHASVEKSFDWDALIWLMQTGKMKEFYAVILHFFEFNLKIEPILPSGYTVQKREPTQHRDEFGAILGSVNLDGCTSNSPSPWAMPESKFHWIVSHAKPITPISARGMLGLWNYELPEEKKGGVK